jgi:hypothetical protein
MCGHEYQKTRRLTWQNHADGSHIRKNRTRLVHQGIIIRSWRRPFSNVREVQPQYVRTREMGDFASSIEKRYLRTTQVLHKPQALFPNKSAKTRTQYMI